MYITAVTIIHICSCLVPANNRFVAYLLELVTLPQPSLSESATELEWYKTKQLILVAKFKSTYWEYL
jgi:hypothetical protein